jgi:hypothetical protein
VRELSVNDAPKVPADDAFILVEVITGLCPVRDLVICPAGGFTGTIFRIAHVLRPFIAIPIPAGIPRHERLPRTRIWRIYSSKPSAIMQTVVCESLRFDTALVRRCFFDYCDVRSETHLVQSQ